MVPTRRDAARWSTLGDGTELDTLAFRDHVLGLEAELAEARAQITALSAHTGIVQRNDVIRVLRGLRRRARALAGRLRR